MSVSAQTLLRHLDRTAGVALKVATEVVSPSSSWQHVEPRVQMLTDDMEAPARCGCATVDDRRGAVSISPRPGRPSGEIMIANSNTD